MIIKYEKDYIIIENTSNSELQLTIKNGDTVIVEEIILINNNYVFYPPKDATYNINGYYVATPDEEYSFNIPYYLYSLKIFTRRFFEIICDCSCSNCFTTNSIISILDLALLDEKIKVYLPSLTAFSNYYKEFESLIFSGEACNPELVINSGVKLNSNENTIIKKLLIDFIVVYKYVENVYDEEYIKDLFRINNLSCCYSKYGFDLNNLLNNNYMGTFTINIAEYINQPPDQVGDYTTNVDNRASITLTSAMFTTSTTPVYHDPEGDPAVSIKILSLPTSGTLTFNGNTVSVNQIISITDIDNGLLTYTAPDQDNEVVVTFDFSVADSGSGQFTA